MNSKNHLQKRSNKLVQVNAETRSIEKLLMEHFPESQDFPPRAYRYNPASIRVRVVSDRFKGKNRVQRWNMVLPILKTLPEDTYQDITILLLYTQKELENAMGNREFENPTPPPRKPKPDHGT